MLKPLTGRNQLWLIVCCTAILVSCIMSGDAFAQATSITSTGFRATEGGGGALTTEYTTGNLGNTWSEGEWVPYQLIINNVQTDYPNLDGFPNIIMSYDFTGGGDKRFVDLVRSIQAGTATLSDAQGWPQDGGTAYPMATRGQIEDAQNDVGNTGDLENIWPGFANLDLPNSQVNRFRSGPNTFTDGTPTDAEHTFYITKQDLLDAGIPLTANTIVIYYQLHESRTFIWQNSLQEQYDQAQTDDWGGYLYSLASYASDARLASGYVPGSSGHIEVEFASGSKTVPIPIPEQLPGIVSGFKWNDVDGNGLLDGSETRLSGWRITVEGTLEGINFSADTLTDDTGYYNFPNLTSGVVWSIRENSQRFDPATTGWMQTYPSPGTVFGVGTGYDFGSDAVLADDGWHVALTAEFSDQGDMNFGNKQCEVSIACPPNTSVDCSESTDPSNTGYPTVTSNCSTDPAEYSDNTVPGDCDIDGYLYQIERTWTVVDEVGNADTCVQVITVTDTTPPVISGVGADDTIECPAEPVFSNPTASDDCSEVSLTFADVTTPGDCPEEYSVTRTWTATDECGNSSQASQTINVIDTTPPVISGVGADDTIECPATPEFSTPTASDLCDDNPSLTFADVTTPGNCPEEYSVTRTWTATDGCGNSSQASQTINVEDNTPPVISGVGADDTIECPAEPQFSTPTASDLCDENPSLTFADVTTPGNCPEEYSVTRTWTATDGCGNSSQASQTINVEDNTPPVISGVGDDGSVECPAEPVFSTPTASDLCDDNPSLTYEDATTPGDCPQEYCVTRTWTATDACGNSSQASQRICVEDNTPPVITCPNDTTFDCSDVGAFGQATAEDACDPDPSIGYDDVVLSESCPQQIQRTWYAEDACGNRATCVQLVTIIDETPPVISGVGDDANIECPNEPVFSEPTASDLCDQNPSLTYEDVRAPGNCPQEYCITRTWTATDYCGNSSSASQTICVEDNTPPTISGVGDDGSVECPAEPEFSTPTASDLCDDNPSLTYQDATTPGDCPQEYCVTRTWTATDACGNSAQASQTICVTDDTAPEITGVGDDEYIDCPNTPEFSTPTASDLCDPNPSLTFEDSRTDLDCGYSITRYWTATDACGNSSNADQTITVQDTIPPTITCAADGEIACLDDLVFTPPTASDECDAEPEVISLGIDSTSGPGPNQTTYTQSWYAVDDCGNASDTCSQNIIRTCITEYCTYTMGGWGAGCPDSQADDPFSTQPGCIRDHYFDDVYPGGEVVIGDASGYTARWTSAAAVEAYLPAGTTPGVLTGNLVNPTSTPAGVLAGQILALTMNVDYSCAGVFELVGLSGGNCYADFVIPDTCSGKFSGMTVSEFLALANLVLSGDLSALDPYHAKPSHLVLAATCLNELYDACMPPLPVASISIESNNQLAETSTATKGAGDALPSEYSLDQNHPNPFNPMTQINYALPEAAHVKLVVYNVLGQPVATLVDRNEEAGYHSVTWNAVKYASGIYFYSIQANSFVMNKKMILLK